jgi:hypothetical protein
MKRTRYGTIAGATMTLVAASFLLAGLFASPAQAAGVKCDIRKNDHLIRCSNETNDTYQIRLRVRLEGGRRPQSSSRLTQTGRGTSASLPASSDSALATNRS